MTNIKPFALEGYCAKYLHSAKYMLSCSDCESLSMAELVAILRPWQVAGRSVRPEMRISGHTGFIVNCRRKLGETIRLERKKIVK